MEQYIQPFIKVSEKVFHEFCKTEVKAGRVFFVNKDEHKSDWDISGVIGLSGEVSGAVAISLKDQTAYQVTTHITGEDHKSIDSDVTDAVGEIINIIAGNVKKHFEENFKIKISLPTIVTGKSHSIVWPSEKTRILSIPFSIFSDQEICLSVAVDPTK
jgi:chemotaxis protein CheX